MNSKEKFRISPYLTKKNARGITLIALVITIIVLLILAAVTINALSGDNGILKRATEAKQKTRRADALEKIKLAVMTATTNGVGEANLDDLKAELEKAGATVKTTGELPWEVTLDGYMFRINENLSIDEISGVGISKKELKLLNGASETLTATVTEGVTGTIKWESSNPSVATVENGKVTAVGTSGTATITVKVDGTDYSDTCTVSIVQKVTSLKANDLTVRKKATAKIDVTTTPSGLVEDLTYTSGATNIATVAQDGTVTGVAEGTATITIKGKVSTNVSTTCTVTVKKALVDLTAEQIAANKEKYYGKVAENYTQGGLTYKIFYVDTKNKFGDGANTVYLKADYKDKISLTEHISYNPEENDLEVYKRMNPLWSAQRGSIAPASWNNNERVAGWLCSPSQWESYLDNTKATYAIGGPSAEMYVASYNDVKHDTGTAKGGLSAEYSSSNEPGYIYKVNGTLYNGGWSTADGTLDYKGYNSMYAGINGIEMSYNWWLASPSSGNPYLVCYVDSYHTALYYAYSDMIGVGPLVSLKSGIPVQVEE